MVTRIWHGYTTPGNAQAYEDLLKTKIFPYIAAKKITGYKQIELIKRELKDEVEFITIMRFGSLDNIIQFAGNDYETAVVLPEAAALLKRFDSTSQHYTQIVTVNY